MREGEKAETDWFKLCYYIGREMGLTPMQVWEQFTLSQLERTAELIGQDRKERTRWDLLIHWHDVSKLDASTTPTEEYKPMGAAELRRRLATGEI